MKKIIIDRFEGSYAVCEDEAKNLLSISRQELPQNCKEGDILIEDSKGKFQQDQEAMNIRRKRIQDKMSRLFQ